MFFLKIDLRMGVGMDSAMKKLLMLGAACGMSSTAMSAEVKVYGKASASIAQFSAKEADTSGVFVNSAGSRLGVKASEDISETSKGVAVLEFGVNLSQKGTSAFSSRDKYVGIECNTIGHIYLGYKDTPYKLASTKHDVFGDTFADHNNIISGPVLDRRGENAITYESPSFSGVSFAIQYSDQAQATLEKFAPYGQENFASGSVTYKNDMLHIVLAHEALSGNPSNPDPADANKFLNTGDIAATKLAVGVNFGATRLNIIAEQIDEDAKDDTTFDRTNVLLGVKHSVGKWDALFQYGMWYLGRGF